MLVFVCVDDSVDTLVLAGEEAGAKGADGGGGGQVAVVRIDVLIRKSGAEEGDGDGDLGGVDGVG